MRGPIDVCGLEPVCSSTRICHIALECSWSLLSQSIDRRSTLDDRLINEQFVAKTNAAPEKAMLITNTSLSVTPPSNEDLDLKFVLQLSDLIEVSPHKS